MMVRSRSACFLFASLFAVAAQAQDDAEDDVRIEGRIRDYFSSAPITDAYVAVRSANGIDDTVAVNDTAGYGFEVPYDDLYQLRYCAPGKVTKWITIDTRNIPPEEQEGGHGMHVDMTLFDARPGRDYSFMEQPMGVARYSAKDSAVTWDMAITERMKVRIDSVMRDSSMSRTQATGPTASRPNGGIGLTELLLIAFILFVFLSGGIVIGLVLFFRRKKM